MFEDVKKECIKVGMKLDRYGLIALSGGNISVRVDKDTFVVTPSGMIYEDMVIEDMLVVDKDGKIIEGTRKPSVDTAALLYIFDKMPHINAVIHTHQPYATGLGLVLDEIPCNLTTIANAVYGPIHVAPYSGAASIDMGIKTVEYIGDSLAVVLKHHGIVAIGENLKQALYSCVYLEEGAKTISVAYALDKKLPPLTLDAIQEAVDVFKYKYGQDKK